MTTHISLRLTHPTHDLSNLAKKLQLPVSRIWTAGEARSAPKGDALTGKQQESYCAMKIVTPAGTIAAAIDAIRHALAGSPSLTSDFSTAHLRKSLYCTLESEGEVLELDALRALLEMEIRLEISGC